MDSPRSEHERPVRIFLGGDTVLFRSRAELEDSGALGLLELQRKCDVVAVNCEMTLSEHGSVQAKDLSCARPEQAAVLAWAGVTLASVANNHTGDLGVPGLLRTIEVLRQNGICTSGGGRDLAAAWAPAVVERKGLKIALLSVLCTEVRSSLFPATDASAGVATIHAHQVCRPRSSPLAAFPAADHADVARMQAAVGQARASADVVLVSLHTHVSHPYAVEPVRPVAHAAIDAGADLVFAHGSHAIEPIERYSDRLIFHGLGNLFFQLFERGQVIPDIGTTWANRRLLAAFAAHEDYWNGLAVCVAIDLGRRLRADIYPLHLNPDGNPALARGARAERILQRLGERSAPMGVALEMRGDLAAVI